MPRSNELKQSFKGVCRDFFPGSEVSHWTIRRPTKKENQEIKGPWQGYCIRERKLILIGYIPSNHKSLCSLIIHEACHAVTDDNHGKVFQKRLLKASQRAYELGDRLLGNMIIHDVKRIKKF